MKKQEQAKKKNRGMRHDEADKQEDDEETTYEG